MNNNLPTVSVCTPTYNRRPFIPIMTKCFLSQTYPQDKLEWIIIDDGTDKIEDLVSDIGTVVKYFPFDEKMTLGAKRNLMHKKATGDFIVYMDDDDYYPPDRIKHAIDTLLANPQALCAGSSIMFIYFKHIAKMYQFGPYGPNHATAATFAFRRELLNSTHFEDDACLAEEKHFLKNYTIPFIQLDPIKTILVFSHIHNTFDKKELLENPNMFVKPSTVSIDDFIHDSKIKNFFLNDIDHLLKSYEPGEIKNKPDVLKQIEKIKLKRKQQEEDMRKSKINSILNKHPLELANEYEKQIADLFQKLKSVSDENHQLKEKTIYLEKTITNLIKKQIEYRCSLNK